MMSVKTAEPEFREGDDVVVTEGSYPGTTGVFLRLREDHNWADIAEPNGTIRSHPVAWLKRSNPPERIKAS